MSDIQDPISAESNERDGSSAINSADAELRDAVRSIDATHESASPRAERVEEGAAVDDDE